MKKRVKARTFSRKKDQRKALLISLARSLVEKEKIKTTEAKAKEVSPFVEKLITKAKHGTLASRRQIVSSMGEQLAKKMIDELATRFTERKGGYTRVIKLGARQSDGARMAIIEFVK